MEALLEWARALEPHLAVFILGMVPYLEVRAAIPFGLLITELTWYEVWIVGVIGNWLIAPVVYLLIKQFIKLLELWPWFDRIWDRYCDGLRKRIHGRVEKYGSFGLALFIGIPIPGSGVYAGALGAYLLGMNLRTYIWVSLVGVAIASSILTAVVLSGSEAFMWMTKEHALPAH